MTATTATTTLYLVLDAEADLAQASALDGFHDLDDEARDALIAAYEDAYIAVAKRLYGDRVDVLIPDDGAAADDWWRRNADEDAARDAWQAIHDELDLTERPDRVDLTDGRHVHEQISTAPAVAFAVCDAAYGEPEVLIVERDGTDQRAYNGEPVVRAPWRNPTENPVALYTIVDSLGYLSTCGAIWEPAGDFLTLAVAPK